MATVFCRCAGLTTASDRLIEVSAPVVLGQAVIYVTPVGGMDRVVPATNTSEVGSYVVGVAATTQLTVGSQVLVRKLGIVPGSLATVLPLATAGIPIFLGPAGEPVRFTQVAGPPVASVRLGFAANTSDLDVDVQWIGWRP